LPTSFITDKIANQTAQIQKLFWLHCSKYSSYRKVCLWSYGNLYVISPTSFRLDFYVR